MSRKIIYTILALFLLAAGCTKEEGLPGLDGGKKAVLSLDVFTGSLPNVIVKSWEDNSTSEAAVNNLRVYIFSEGGRLIGYKLFSSSDLNFTSDGTNDNGYDRSSPANDIETETGRAYIYGIANATTSQYWAESKFLNVTDVSNVGFTREDFLKAMATRQDGAFNPLDNIFLMTGYVNGGNPVTISLKTGSSTDAEISSPTADDAKRLKLYKVVSKNRLTVTVDNSLGKNITFTPDYFAIHNVPKSFSLFPELPSADESYRTAASGFEDFDRIVTTENSYTVYLPENLQSTTASIGSFNDREANSYSGDTKNFTNAPANATYVTVHGRYESDDYVGMVSYTIHLGDFGTEESTTRNWGDFNVTRNYAYDYTITIKGVNNFVAEANKSGTDPGSEGTLVSKSGNTVFDLDAHYEARVIKVTMADVKKLISENSAYSFMINTYFGSTPSPLLVTDMGVYDAAGYKDALDNGNTPTPLCTLDADGNPSDVSKIFSNEADWQWMHFVLNTGEWKAHSFSNEWGTEGDVAHGVKDVCAYPGTDNTMNLFQFLKKLYVAAQSSDHNFFNQGEGDDAYAYISVFIDENYYSGKNWTEYVNKTRNRYLYLGLDTYTVSEDQHSSYTGTRYVFSQRPIWTVYSLNDPTVAAFGTESVDEEKVSGLSEKYLDSSFLNAQTDQPSHGEAGGRITNNNTPTSWDGYTSARNNQLSRSDGGNRDSGYSNFNNMTQYGYDVYPYSGHQDLYTIPYKQCASRNRDENGNGKIDADEIKWYLATADQYLAMFIGENVLPSDVRLFDYSTSNWNTLNATSSENRKLWHFFSASTDNTIWAEEAISVGTNSEASMVRCIRTLESNGEGLKNPDNYIKRLDANGDGQIGIEINLADGCFRPYMNGPMPPSYERGTSTTNLPYKKYLVASDNIKDSSGSNKMFSRSEIINDNDDDDFNLATEDVCYNSYDGNGGDNWRVPNLVELAIIRSVFGGRSGLNLRNGEIVWSSTLFTATKSGYYRHNYNANGIHSGIFNIGGNGNLTVAYPTNDKGVVRCVRDVQ